MRTTLSLVDRLCLREIKNEFASCFIAGGLFKLAHAHKTEISQSCSGGIIAPRFFSCLL